VGRSGALATAANFAPFRTNAPRSISTQARVVICRIELSFAEREVYGTLGGEASETAA